MQDKDSTHSGVLFSGTMHGNLTCGDDSEIKLDGIKPKTSGNVLTAEGYLLINAIENSTTLETNAPNIYIQNVNTTNKYSTSGYTDNVAKSLIGTASGKGLKIKFAKIKLDARTTADSVDAQAMYTAYGTYSSIFRDSTLFASIHTDQDAVLEYNYTYDQDWGSGNRNVTYGEEVTSSLEWVDNNNNSREQRYYSPVRNYTNPVSNANTVYDFSSGFLSYVAHPYDSTKDEYNLYYREMKVNVLMDGLTVGCGTYNDPYIITEGVVLENVAALIKNGSGLSLPEINLPKDKTKYDTLAENTSGDRWCDGKADHALFTTNANGSSYQSSSLADWAVENVRYYLANAYYKIDDNLELSNLFSGLGGTESNLAFRGVIIGDTENGAPKYTITNKSAVPFINVSNGCVVKDLNIAVEYENIEIKQDANTNADACFDYESKCGYYGGIIGEIMGGDNIIDNSYVSYQYTEDSNTKNTTIKLTGKSSSGTIVPVGGYVGVVVYGGLIFKNMTAAKTTIANTHLNVVRGSDTVNLANDAGLAAIYVNPIVGRVINGYAVNETTQFSVTEDGKYHDDNKTARGSGLTQHSLKNGKKHYTIADINKNDTNKLDVTAVAKSNTDGNINVPNAQALFILSLITQSGAGTATDAQLGDYDGSLSYGTYGTSEKPLVYGMSHNASYSDVGTNVELIADDPETENVDERNVTDYQKLAIYDTANNADGNAPIPYIVKYYTVGRTTVGITTRTETRTRDVTQTVTENIMHYNKTMFIGAEIPNGTTTGRKFVLKGTRTNDAEYLTNRENRAAAGSLINNRNCILWSTSDFVATDVLTEDENKLKNATEFYFEPDNSGDYCIYYLDSNNQRKYLMLSNVNNSASNRGNLEISNTACYYTVSNNGSKWSFQLKDDSKERYVYYDGGKTYFSGYASPDVGSMFELYEVEVTPTTVSHDVTYEEEYEVIIPVGYTTTHNYPARCVTSTAGFYNINLTGSGTYYLPDSFRGLGCVGMYDSIANTTDNAAKNNKFSMKVNVFDGNNCKIDEDIYLNKFKSDNYFNVLHVGNSQTLEGDKQPFKGNGKGSEGLTENHGIGLFDSVIMKGSSSEIGDFTLTGSVNTEVYNNVDTASGQEWIGVNEGDGSKSEWLSVGGVCGWSTKGAYVKFSNISMRNLTVNGSNFVGGLLGFSGISSTTVKVIIKQCSATDISLKMTSANRVGDLRQSRNGMGAFVGKVQEGAVVIYGTEDENNNDDLSKYSEVTIKSFGFGDNTKQYYISTGGLVGFAGHCCQAYDMRVSSSDATVTIGNANVRFSGGIVGGMQSYNESVNEKTSLAYFKNCKVENINVAGEYAGGFYGGKWDSAWTPYSITLDNCEMAGKSVNQKNSITANRLCDSACAGGFIGRGLVKTSATNATDYNILIKDCRIVNYNITGSASGNNNGYAGGFVGYCSSNANNSTITCYIHDSAVENCKIGAADAKSYGGGAIGWVKPKNTEYTNKMLGYNIKLDNVTTDNTDNMGAWVGYLDSNDDSTSIQFTGMAIYGTGYDKNIGNWNVSQDQANSKASFVFADYTGQCNNYSGNSVSNYKEQGVTNVPMPKYPYVNINPQISMGSGEYISGDGAVLGSDVSGFTGTGKNTLAAKIFADISDTSNTRRYTTFNNADIVSGTTIDDYMNRSINDDGDRISTYAIEKGSLPAGTNNNFAVVVIANQTNSETTNLINRYIQLVTNTATDYTDKSNYYDISVKTCKYQNNKFEIVNDTPGLTWTPPTTNPSDATQTIKGSFALNGTYADSNNSSDTYTFTLVDVQFKDPLDTSMVAYHLYVPVYTIRQMTYNFYASALTDTKSDNSIYENAFATSQNASAHFDSLMTWVTHYVRFAYKKEDIDALLEAGNVNWNHDKYLLFDTQQASSRLPEGTKMILVDPNGLTDRTYYAQINSSGFTTITNGDLTGWRIDFNKFTSDGTSEGTSFSVNDFSKVIANHISATQKSGGAYKDVTSEVANDSTTPYTIFDSKNKKYYLHVTDGSGTHELTVDGDINEDYYISVYVPEPVGYNNELFYYTVQSSDRLTGQKTAAKDVSKPCNVMIAQLFKQQDMSYVVEPSHDQINVETPQLTVKAATTVELNDPTTASYLSSVKLHHAFHILLNRYEKDGNVNNEIIGLETGNITGKYSLNNGTEIAFTNDNIDLHSGYLDVKTKDLMSAILSCAGNRKFVRVSAEITMEFYNIEEFPEKINEGNIGVNVATSSNLAYDEERLSYTSMSEAFPADGKYYHRESATASHLSYSAKSELDQYDVCGRESENFSRLGVNGYSAIGEYTQNNVTRKAMEINTKAVFNAASVEDIYFDNAVAVRYTMRLWKKTDTKVENTVTGAKYVQVNNISDYLLGVDPVNNNNSLTKNTDKSTAKEYVYEMTISDCEEISPRIYPAYIVFYAITGDNFTEYANYQVELQAELIDSHGNTIGNQPKDYIVYTNAKVYPTVIDSTVIDAANDSSNG